MSSEKAGTEPIKVVDRRRLDEDGEERTGAEPSDSAAGTNSNASAQASPSKEKTSEAIGSPPAIDFAVFVQSLAQQALTHLGVLPHPESGEPRRELDLARQTIDILNILHEKTQGNLNNHEKQLLDAIVHDLRMVFVQVSTGQ